MTKPRFTDAIKAPIADTRRSSIRQANGHRRNRRTTLAAVVSVLLHLAMFGYLAQGVPLLRTPQYVAEPDVQLDLTSLPAGPAAAPSPFASPRRASAPARPTPRSALVPNARGAPIRTLSPRATIAPRPAPPRPTPPRQAIAPTNPAATTPNPAGDGSSAAARPGDAAGRNGEPTGDADAGGGVRAFLRATVGCSHEDFANLTAKERAACAVRLARDARAVQDARVDPLTGRDRAYFDALRDADQAARNRRIPGYNCSLIGKPADAAGCALQGGGTGTQGLGATHP